MDTSAHARIVSEREMLLGRMAYLHSLIIPFAHSGGVRHPDGLARTFSDAAEIGMAYDPSSIVDIIESQEDLGTDEVTSLSCSTAVFTKMFDDVIGHANFVIKEYGLEPSDELNEARERCVNVRRTVTKRELRTAVNLSAKVVGVFASVTEEFGVEGSMLSKVMLEQIVATIRSGFDKSAAKAKELGVTDRFILNLREEMESKIELGGDE